MRKRIGVALVLGVAAISVGGLLRARASSEADGLSARHGLAVVGRIIKVDLGGPGDRIDAVSGSTMDASFFVGFEVEAVLKGTWGPPQLGVRLHSPSMTFHPNSEVGDRHLLFFDRGGDGRLVLEQSRPCSWLVGPKCGL